MSRHALFALWFFCTCALAAPPTSALSSSASRRSCGESTQRLPRPYANRARARQPFPSSPEATRELPRLLRAIDRLPYADALRSEIKQVVISLKKRGRLPKRYISKAQARALGWKPNLGNLADVAPGKSIGGDYYANHERLLESGVEYHEADLGYDAGHRTRARIVYGTNGKIYFSRDHFTTRQGIVELK